jgi:hypothetical protein
VADECWKLRDAFASTAADGEMPTYTRILQVLAAAQLLGEEIRDRAAKAAA